MRLIYEFRKRSNKNGDGKTAADLAKGTELEALFTVAAPKLPNDQMGSSFTSKLSTNNSNMAYTAPQSFIRPHKDQKSEAAKPNQDNYLPRSKL